MQISLFDDPVVTFATAIENFVAHWSYSKMQIFWDCPRKFYYKYYGSKKRVAKEEPLKSRLIELAKLSNRYMVQGDIVHKLISLYLKKAKGSEPWDEQRILSFSQKMIDDTIAFNLLEREGNPQKAYPQPIFKELYYRTVSEAELKGELEQSVTTCLTNFFEKGAFSHLRDGAIKLPSKIESKADFSLNTRIKVDGKLDLAFVEDHTLLIADWKTGKREMQDTSLQLLVYALWANGFTEWDFINVEIQKAYLQEGVLEKLAYSEHHVTRARARIMQDAEMLREMDEFGKGAVADAFAQHIGDNCIQCPFEKICHSKKFNNGNECSLG